jgi:hypothetical protein
VNSLSLTALKGQRRTDALRENSRSHRNLSALLFISLSYSQKPAPEGNRQQQVPFVRCPSDGQAGHLEPPPQEPTTATVEEVSAGEIAYYKGVMAPGAFAPRSWHCHVWYGSGGGLLLITPEVLGSAPGSVWPPKTQGQAIELALDDSGASGRYNVAKYALLFFPKTAAKFIQSVNELLDIPISRSSLQPFERDSITATTGTMAEFVTPSDTTGFGTERYLGPSPDPISGIAFLDDSSPYGPNFISVQVRLRASHSDLKAALLRLNRECMQERRGCSAR